MRHNIDVFCCTKVDAEVFRVRSRFENQLLHQVNRVTDVNAVLQARGKISAPVSQVASNVFDAALRELWRQQCVTQYTI